MNDGLKMDERWIDGLCLLDGWMDGWMDVLMDGWIMDGLWMND
jgi:hypothetical protein